MDSPPPTQPAAEPVPDLTILEREQAKLRAKTAAIPPGHGTAIVVGVDVDWKFGVPYWFRFGMAHRSGEHFMLSTEAETKFTKATTAASVHAAWSW